MVLSTAVLGLTVAAATTTLLRWPAHEAALRTKVVETLSRHLDAEVELGTLEIQVFPRFQASGTHLDVRHQGRRDVPPMISVDAFAVRADLVGLWRNRVSQVRLEGLVLAIPPGRDGDHDRDERDPVPSEIIVDELIAEHARLVIIPRDPAQEPRTWAIHHLRIGSAGVHQVMSFQAALTNAVPPGDIDTEGSFGPWDRGEPGQTPIHGRFTFEQADLSHFKGISGILSAHGIYGGSLSRLAVHGETETPDFAVEGGGHPLPLQTTYHAIVDGTNGDTTLERVEATLLNTSIVATGGVFEVEGGREVVLDVAIEDGRLEDVIRLAVSTPTPMTGGLRLEAMLVIPPGDARVIDKLRLDGGFSLDAARFTDAGVQQQINELSARAGRTTDENGGSPRVAADFSGRFALAGGILQLQTLTFDVPGALVELDGTYALRAETLDLSGALFMDAKVSQTKSGFTSLILRVVDPLFRRDGRTVVPLMVTGTRSEPEFRLDLKRVFTRQ